LNCKMWRLGLLQKFAAKKGNAKRVADTKIAKPNRSVNRFGDGSDIHYLEPMVPGERARGPVAARRA